MIGHADQRTWSDAVGRNDVGAIDPDVAGFQASGATRGNLYFRQITLRSNGGHKHMVMPGGS
jgi:hypothetical protein